MPTSSQDAGYLWDRLEAARIVVGFTRGLRYAEYEKNRMMQLAVEREVEIIGEAARKVSSAFKEAHPGIAWAGIVAQRHVLAHDYGTIRVDRMWALATHHIPVLIGQLEPLVPPPPPETDG